MFALVLPSANSDHQIGQATSSSLGLVGQQLLLSVCMSLTSRRSEDAFKVDDQEVSSTQRLRYIIQMLNEEMKLECMLMWTALS